MCEVAEARFLRWLHSDQPVFNRVNYYRLSKKEFRLTVQRIWDIVERYG